MAKGSEQPTWRWAGDAERVCVDCGKPLRVKDICQWHHDHAQKRRWLRCCECLALRTRHVPLVGRQ